MNAYRGSLLLAASVVLAFWSSAGAQDAPPKVLFEKSGELTDQDSFDKLVKKAYSVSFPFKMKAGEMYRIDASSRDIDTLIRIENEDGKHLALDDDGAGEGLNSRLIFKAPADGEYRLIVTTAVANQTGKFKLVVAEPTKSDILVSQVRDFPRLKGEEREKILEQFLGHLDERGKKISVADARLAMNLAYMMEVTKARGLSDTTKKLSQALAASENEDVRGMSKTLEGMGRRARLMGNMMEVKGTLLDGSKFNWDSYRGKVVLVDYWATWCGPCIAELPNVIKLHEAYKDKGFAVVGISIDRDVEALERFVAKRKLPWPTIFERDVKHQPMADYYGVMAIPLPILVDKEGRVISMNARGQELARLLEAQLGPIEEKSTEKE